MLAVWVTEPKTGFSGIHDLDSFDSIFFEKSTRMLFGVSYKLGIKCRVVLGSNFSDEEAMKVYEFLSCHWRMNNYSKIIYSWSDLLAELDSNGSEDIGTKGQDGKEVNERQSEQVDLSSSSNNSNSDMNNTAKDFILIKSEQNKRIRPTLYSEADNKFGQRW